MKNLNVAGIFEDVGANSGYYSLLASTIVGEKGRVYSFEPDHKTFNRLVRNVELNSMVNVNALNIALSSFDGEGELSVSQTSDGLNSLKPIPLVKQKVKIKVRKLDTVLNGEIDIIKIDAEGSTLDIINGGTNVISLSKGIKIIYELDKNRVTNEKLFNTLNLMGFKSFALKDGNLSTMISKFDDLPKGIGNLVAVRNIGISKSG
jgi:FkbM family methyltransferase